jgi:hypothetical protein
MTSHVPISTDQVRKSGMGARLRVALTGLSDRVHAAGDARARAMGWAVTTVPGPLGLSGRAYRHPGFAPNKADHQPEHGRPAGREPRRLCDARQAAARGGPDPDRQDTADA